MTINTVLFLNKRMHWPRCNYESWDTWKGHFRHARNANCIPEQEAQMSLKPAFVCAHARTYSSLPLLIQSCDHQFIHSLFMTNANWARTFFSLMPALKSFSCLINWTSALPLLIYTATSHFSILTTVQACTSAYRPRGTQRGTSRPSSLNRRQSPCL